MLTACGFKLFIKLLRFLAAILSFDVLHTKPPRRFDSCLKDTLMLLKIILEEPRN
jgi:hypothetical protein